LASAWFCFGSVEIAKEFDIGISVSVVIEKDSLIEVETRVIALLAPHLVNNNDIARIRINIILILAHHRYSKTYI